MQFLNLGCPQKLYNKTRQVLSDYCFIIKLLLCSCEYDVKLNPGSTPFSIRKYKGSKKTSNVAI